MFLVYLLFVGFIVEFCLKRLFNKDRYSNDKTYKLTRYPFVNTIQYDKLFEPCNVATDKNCHNIPIPLTIRDSNDSHILTLDPNNDPTQGFILPNIRDFSNFQCTPTLGVAILVVDDYEMLKQGGTSKTELHCRCKYPELMTNRSSLMDCTIPIGCKPNGTLIVEKSGDKFKDPLLYGVCKCPDKYMIGDRTDTTGPFCRSMNLSEIDSEELTKVFKSDVNLSTTDSTINAVLDQDYLKQLPANFKEIPNPCNIDIRSGKTIPSADVELVLINDIATCVPTKLDGRYATLTTDTDYLKNNNGTYPNAVTLASNDPQKMYMYFVGYKSEVPRIGFYYPKSSFSDEPHFIFRHNLDTETYRNSNENYKNAKAYGPNNLQQVDFSTWRLRYPEDSYYLNIVNILPCSKLTSDYADYVKNNLHPQFKVDLCLNEDTGRLQNQSARTVDPELYEIDFDLKQIKIILPPTKDTDIRNTIDVFLDN